MAFLPHCMKALRQMILCNVKIAAAAVVLLCAPSLCSAEYAVQVGAFTNPVYFNQAAATLKSAGFSTINTDTNAENAPALSLLLAGPYRTQNQAEAARQALAKLGFDGFVRQLRSSLNTADILEPAVKPVPVVLTISTDQQSYRPFFTGVHLTDSPFVRSSYLAAEDPFSTAPEPQPPATKPALPFSINGYVQNDVAYTVASPDHWSKFRNMAEIALKANLTDNVSFKVSGRFWYDGVFDFTTFFPHQVKSNQRFEAMFRETYLDAGIGNWNFRVGRQQIVWGEVVGLFVADVVSALELRDFIIPDLDYIRTPQWAARAEYFRGDFKAEAIWIPYMTYDQIGKPGADFYPFPPPPPPGFAEVIRNERQPHQLDNSGVGVRASYLISGWDLAAFYYGSTNVSPTFFRQISAMPTPTFVYTPNHDRINQIGGTVSKDFESFVLKGEAVYTFDQWFNVTRLNDPNGVVRQGFLDYILSVDFPLPWESRLNVQFFQRWFPSHDPDMLQRSVESGASLLVSTKLFDDKVEPELLFIESLNRLDYFTRFRISWRFKENWRAVLGTAFFGGSKTGLFGRFGDKDRVFTELRFAF